MITIMLSQRLAEKGWTQADLARKTGIRKATINEMYHNLVERIDLEQVCTICEVLEIDVCDLLTAHYDVIIRAEQLARRKASHYLNRSSQERVPGAPRGYRHQSF